jgi:hypothetical protein
MALRRTSTRSLVSGDEDRQAHPDKHHTSGCPHGSASAEAVEQLHHEVDLRPQVITQLPGILERH